MKSSFIRVWTGLIAWLLVSLLPRLAASSLLDPSFRLDPRVTGHVDVVAVQADGKILAAGIFTNFTATERAVLVRLETNGMLDPTFATQLETQYPELYPTDLGAIRDIKLLSDGRIVVGRWLTWSGPSQVLLRTDVHVLKQDGTIVTSFLLFGHCRLAVDGNDRIVAAGADGYAVSTSFMSRPILLRVFADGRSDPELRPPLAFTNRSPEVIGIKAVKVAKNGDLLLAGSFCMASVGVVDTIAMRLSADGTLLWKRGNFTMGLTPSADFIDEDNAGDVVVKNQFYSPLISRLLPDGTPKPEFALAEFHYGPFTPNMLLEPFGRLVVLGRFASVAGIPRAGLAALNPNGSIDKSFSPGAGFGEWNDQLAANTIAQQADGRIIVGGWFQGFDGIVQPWLVRLFPRNPDEPPWLMVRAVDSSLEISWPDTASGFALETAATLEAEAKWQPSSASITQENGVFKATLPTTNSAGFFRLRK